MPEPGPTIEQVFREDEPYLGKAVRRQLPVPLRAKFDSTDILQSVWADVLSCFREAGWVFRDADQLRRLVGQGDPRHHLPNFRANVHFQAQ